MKSSLCLSALLCLAVIGCKQPNDSASAEADGGAEDVVTMDGAPPTSAEDDHAGHDHAEGDHAGHDHAEGAHPQHGPHNGELVELGKEAFHLEIVHGEGAVAFYVLDGAAIEPVAIPASTLTVGLKHEGQVKRFDLDADPQASDPEGSTSRFTSTVPEFEQWLDAEAEGAVTVQIEGKSFTGNIKHDHAGHDHAGHDH